MSRMSWRDKSALLDLFSGLVFGILFALPALSLGWAWGLAMFYVMGPSFYLATLWERHESRTVLQNLGKSRYRIRSCANPS